MNNAVVTKVENILKSEFSIDRYVELIKEIFSTVRIISPDRFKDEFTNFSSHIEKSAHIGNYVSPSGEKVLVYAVQLRQQTYVENSRSTQRSYAKKLIENGNYDAALVAFFTPNDPKWRLSFIRLDYEMKVENGRIKTEEKLTPAKRYSYLVGKDEPCHTAIDRFHSFITNNNSQPTLDELEEAFSVEAVTKEFFELYCEKFYQLVDYLETNDAFIAESSRCGFSTEQFAKKLMGQIVFLYFLQKKGWLGVGVWPQTISEKEYKDIYYTQRVSAGQKVQIQKYLPVIYVKNGNVYKFKGLHALESIPDDVEESIANVVPGDRNWGNGSKTFLRTWFDFASKHDGRFYDDYLEPLFYATLNKNRGELGYSPILHCRVPFLSGGLFEPIDGYDWENTNFNIPDEIFSNKSTVDDKKADGILDIFDRYNFTMCEDEPMEREVAIDPEMLGKVFENLLDVKDRKSKGAFYTPREIVHYMCQECLVNYLASNLDISTDAVRDFVLYGDFYKDFDTEKTKKVTDANGKIHYEFDIERQFKISPDIFSPKDGIDRIAEIDDLLKRIRVADPAVGSGAFPLGMLNEIVRARQNLSAYMATKMNAYNIRLMYSNERSAHSLKYETIKNCIFAADIEPSAVDIAQLRLWLALVIDDEINPEAQSVLDGHRNPLPLPNLECNIICGNSLVNEFAGHRLIPQSKILGTESAGEEYSWNQMALETMVPQLIDAQDRLFTCDDPIKKLQIKAEVEALKDQIIGMELSLLSKEEREQYEESKRRSSKPYVLWQVEFARVFKEKGGFDIVVGNPPYVRVQELPHEVIDYYKAHFETAWKRIDISTLFIELGNRLIRTGGRVSFITSNQFLTTEYGRLVRKFLVDNSFVEKMVDFGDLPVFENALTYVSIFFFAKNQKEMLGYYKVPSLPFTIPSDNSFFSIGYDSLSDDNWNLTSPILSKCLNTISKATKEHLSDHAKCWAGAITGKDDILMFAIDESVPFEEDMLISVVRAEGCERYAEAVPTKKIFYPYEECGEETKLLPLEKIRERYPKAYGYIMDNEKELKERKDSRKTFGDKEGWYGLVRFGKLSRFKRPKIVSPGEVKRNKFSLDLTGSAFSCARVFSITVEDSQLDIKYLLGILNSKVCEFYLHNNTSLKQGGYYSYSSTAIDAFPLIISKQYERDIVEIVDAIIEKKRGGEGDVSDDEKRIDQMVYKMYGLTQDEVDAIEKCLEE